MIQILRTLVQIVIMTFKKNNKQRKIDRPPINELKILIEKNGYIKTGKMFGVSDNTIRKWLKAYEKGL